MYIAQVQYVLILVIIATYNTKNLQIGVQLERNFSSSLQVYLRLYPNLIWQNSSVP